MGRLLNIWRAWSVRRRAVTSGVLAVAAAGAGIGAYEILKRPPDVRNESVDFTARQQPQPKKPVDRTFDWTTYGFDNSRTRYIPSKVVKPPFGSSDWSFQAGKLLEFSPIIVDDTLYFMDIDARFYALNAKNGNVRWKQRMGELNASAPAYANGRLFGVNLAPGQAFALRPGDGKVLWRTPLPGRSESSPLAFKNKLVIIGCECGTVFALDQKTGSIKWTVDTSGPVKGSLSKGKGNVYGGNYAGEAFAINARTGREKWRVDTIGGSFGRGGGIYSTPAVAFGRVYFGSIDSRIYSLDMDTGEIAWSRSTGAEVYSAPVVADAPGTEPSVYIGSVDRNFYALDARNGEVRWQKSHNGLITGAATIIGDVVYVGVIGDGGGTYGYRIKDGKKVFEHELGEYNPVITDGERLYLTGYSALRAFPPKGKDEKRKGNGKAGAKKGKPDKHKQAGRKPARARG